MWLLLVTVALAGYGDPTDGVPDPAERELFVWTDAARVDLPALGERRGGDGKPREKQDRAQNPLRIGCSYCSADASVFHGGGPLLCEIPELRFSTNDREGRSRTG